MAVRAFSASLSALRVDWYAASSCCRFFCSILANSCASFTWASSSRSLCARAVNSEVFCSGPNAGATPVMNLSPSPTTPSTPLDCTWTFCGVWSVATAPFAPRTIAIGPCGAAGPAPKPPGPPRSVKPPPGVKPRTLSAPPNSGTAAGPEARRPTAAATVPPTTLFLAYAAMSPPGAPPAPQSPNGGTVLVLRLVGLASIPGGTPPPAGGATRPPPPKEEDDPPPPPPPPRAGPPMLLRACCCRFGGGPESGPGLG